MNSMLLMVVIIGLLAVTCLSGFFLMAVLMLGLVRPGRKMRPVQQDAKDKTELPPEN